MQVTINGAAIVATREATDKPIYGSAHFKGDGMLLHRIKTELRRQGHDVVKIRAGADKVCGPHLTDGDCPILRERKGRWVAQFDAYALRNACEDFNAGKVVLNVTQ